MGHTHAPAQLDAARLLAVIGIQTEIVQLGADLGAVMDIVTHRAQELTGADGAVLELAEGEDMVYRAVSGTAAGQLGLHLKRSTSLSGLCVADGKPLRCDDSEADPRVDREACRRVGLRSMVVVPLSHAGRIVGVLKVIDGTRAAFDDHDEHVLGLLSSLVAAAMFHADRLQNESDELFHRATHDPLTGLANRALYYDRLRQQIVQARREQAQFAVLMIDMDGLKLVNDTLGHRAGDAAISTFGTRLKAASREGDTIARLGGDEFAVILQRVGTAAQLETAIERLGSALEGQFEFEGAQRPLGASIGGALFPEHGGEIEMLVEHADRGMYANKRARKAAKARA